jgi:phosphotriesterase-related protein
MVHTVLGPIAAEEMGVTLAHEHIACFSHSMKQTFGERWFKTDELISAAVKLLLKARDRGLGTLIDGTPNNLGRDIRILREVSGRSGVNIVASSGMYYSESAFLENKSPEFFADFFIYECVHGMAGTDSLPGILKCATGAQGFTPNNITLLKTMALVQKATGLPLFAHNIHALKTGLRQLDILEQSGVDLSRVIVGHCSDTCDLPYLESLLERGCYLGFDRLRPNADGNRAQAETICALIRRGWLERLLLSHDYCVFLDFRNNSWADIKAQGFEDLPLDFTYIQRCFLPVLRGMGVTELQIKRMTSLNPASIFEPQHERSAAVFVRNLNGV